MEKPSPLRYFLGANSRHGFRSLYDGFCRAEEGCFLHVIKGGPGCGKSSFMGRIGRAAEEKGISVEYVLCSGDPDSLDGVYIPELRLGYVDGTAPHVIEAAFPGAASAYLDLGRYYDSKSLRPHADEIMDINRRYKSLYEIAYRQIAAGAALMPRCQGSLWGDAEKEKILKKVAGFAKREFPPAAGRGHVRDCFMSAISCKGRISALERLSGQCDRLCLIDNELGMGHFYLQSLLPLAMNSGLEVLVCRDCLEPELIEAIMLPELSLALCCTASRVSAEGAYRHIRLDAIADREELSHRRPMLRRSRRLAHESLALATDTLAMAKALHDDLEAVYNPFVDFDSLYSEAERHIDLYL